MPEPIVDQTPAPGTPPAPPAAPPPPAAAAPPPHAPAPKPPKSDFLRIPKKDFRVRVEREAMTILEEKVKTELGCTLEEAKAVIAVQRAAAGAAPAAGDPAARAAAAAAESAKDAEIERLKQENQRLATSADEEKRRGKKAVNRQKDENLLIQMRLEAVRSGINGERNISYAINELRAAILATPDGQDPPQPGTFFSGLLKELPHIGKGPETAPPVVVPQHPSTVPAGAAGAAPPAPTGAGGPVPVKPVDELDERQFAEQTRAKYGYTPGQI